MKIRNLQPQDRNRILEIVTAVGNFNETEIYVAMELVDDALARHEDSDHIVRVLEDASGFVPGYVCFGKTPLTDSTYDFYWMAVHPDSQHQGFGRTLISFVEHDVKRRGGTLLVLETSSLESYQRTVRIYERCGYVLAARIRNFYRAGDDKLVYIKELGAGPCVNVWEAEGGANPAG